MIQEKAFEQKKKKLNKIKLQVSTLISAFENLGPVLGTQGTWKGYVSFISCIIFHDIIYSSDRYYFAKNLKTPKKFFCFQND